MIPTLALTLTRTLTRTLTPTLSEGYLRLECLPALGLLHELCAHTDDEPAALLDLLVKRNHHTTRAALLERRTDRALYGAAAHQVVETQHGTQGSRRKASSQAKSSRVKSSRVKSRPLREAVVKHAGKGSAGERPDACERIHVGACILLRAAIRPLGPRLGRAVCLLGCFFFWWWGSLHI